jgi:hypothetical protein
VPVKSGRSRFPAARRAAAAVASPTLARAARGAALPPCAHMDSATYDVAERCAAAADAEALDAFNRHASRFAPRCALRVPNCAAPLLRRLLLPLLRRFVRAHVRVGVARSRGARIAASERAPQRVRTRIPSLGLLCFF